MQTRPKRPAAREMPADSVVRKSAASEAKEVAGFSRSERLKIGAISMLAWILIWVINWTVRFEVEEWSNFQRFKDQKQPVILSFWHNQIFSATFFWRFRRIVVITSRHFDGEYIARIIRLFGYGTARGSSTRGAVKALLELKKCLGNGEDVGFAIDGPRGPLYQVKPGPVWLSRKTGHPILPFHVEHRRFWQLKSWDRFRIPKPFTRTLVKIGNPLWVPPAGDDALWLKRYQGEMDRLRLESESHWQRRAEKETSVGE